MLVSEILTTKSQNSFIRWEVPKTYALTFIGKTTAAYCIYDSLCDICLSIDAILKLVNKYSIFRNKTVL